MHIVRGRVRAYYSATHTADVEAVRGPAALLGGLPVVAQCPAGFLSAGREVAVLLWDDVGGVVLGPYGANADHWALAGRLATPYTPTTRVHEFHPAGLRAVANNTFVDILRFTAGSGQTGKVATVSGLLTLTALVYCTGGYYQMRSRLLFVSLRKMTTNAMQSVIQQIGSDNVLEWSSRATTLTVQEKAGATATELVIEAKVSAADYNTGNLFYTFIAGRGAMSTNQVITAEVISDQ